jgi:hypothetical protein
MVGRVGEKVSERLQASLVRLRKDIDRVEVWAGALEGFSRPIPEYDPGGHYKLMSEDDALKRNSASTS